MNKKFVELAEVFFGAIGVRYRLYPNYHGCRPGMVLHVNGNEPEIVSDDGLLEGSVVTTVADNLKELLYYES